MLRSSHESIVAGSKLETTVIGGVRSDGLVRPEEAQWGRYLVTLPEHDHLEIVGFNYEYMPYTVYKLVVDNLRLSEIKDDPLEAKLFGVDHFFNES